MSQLSARRLGPLAAALCVLAGARVADESGARIAALLAAADGSPEALAALPAALAALQPAPVSELFLVLREDAIPADWDPRGAPERQLAPPLHDAVEQALAALPWASVRPMLASSVVTAAGEDVRAFALRLLERSGDAHDLRLFVRLAAPHDGGEPPGRELRRALERALTAVLARDPEAVRSIPTLFDVAAPVHRAALVRAVEVSRAPEALTTLMHLLGRMPALDPLVLIAITRLAEGQPLPGDPHVQSAVRAYLTRGDSTLVQQAALATGALEDQGAVATLCALLRSRNDGIVRAAHEALRRVSGKQLPPDPLLWESWLHEETVWWEERGPRLFGELSRGEPQVTAAAIVEIGRHRLYRHELAGALCVVLGRREPELARLACGALGQLGSWAAVAALADCLDRREARVVAAAREALVRITGLQAPTSRQAWLRATGID